MTGAAPVIRNYYPEPIYPIPSRNDDYGYDYDNGYNYDSFQPFSSQAPRRISNYTRPKPKPVNLLARVLGIDGSFLGVPLVAFGGFMYGMARQRVVATSGGGLAIMPSGVLEYVANGLVIVGVMAISSGSGSGNYISRITEGAGKAEVKIFEKNANHIFRDSEGHFKVDTPANRQTLTDVANNKGNYLGKDKYGSEWYAKTTDDGRQIWTQVRNGEIRNAGINDMPIEFNPITGLSAPVKPK